MWKSFVSENLAGSGFCAFSRYGRRERSRRKRSRRARSSGRRLRSGVVTGYFLRINSRPLQSPPTDALRTLKTGLSRPPRRVRRGVLSHQNEAEQRSFLVVSPDIPNHAATVQEESEEDFHCTSEIRHSHASVFCRSVHLAKVLEKIALRSQTRELTQVPRSCMLSDTHSEVRTRRRLIDRTGIETRRPKFVFELVAVF